MSAGSRADSLGIYLTGAVSDGGAQTDADASLGGYRSSTEVTVLGSLLSGPLAYAIPERVLGHNGEGDGTLRVQGGTFYWTPPGGVEGSGVSIADGETRVVEGVGRDDAVVVLRNGVNAPDGSMSIDLSPVFNNPIGMSNVLDADRTAGSTVYRAVMFRPKGSFGVLDIRVWLGVMTGQSTISIAIEAPGTGGDIQTIADETTAPTSLSWTSPTTEGAALHISSLDVGNNYGLWIRRVFPAAGTKAEREEILLQMSYYGV